MGDKKEENDLKMWKKDKKKFSEKKLQSHDTVERSRRRILLPIERGCKGLFCTIKCSYSAKTICVE